MFFSLLILKVKKKKKKKKHQTKNKTPLCIRFDIVVFYQWKYEKSWGLRDVVYGVRRTYLNLWKLPCSWY